MSLAFIAVAAVTVGTIAGFKWWFSTEQVTRRALSAVTATPVTEVQEGAIVKLVGRATLAGAPLTAPISERPCLAWNVAIEVRRGSGNKKRWREVHQDSDVRGFVLEDATGRARIDVSRARVVLSEDHRAGHDGGWSDGSVALLAYCGGRGVDTSTFFGGSVPVRSREGVIDLGELVTVMGVARFEDDPSAAGDGYRSMGKLLVLEAPSDAPLLISDHLDLQR